MPAPCAAVDGCDSRSRLRGTPSSGVVDVSHGCQEPFASLGVAGGWTGCASAVAGEGPGPNSPRRTKIRHAGTGHPEVLRSHGWTAAERPRGAQT